MNCQPDVAVKLPYFEDFQDLTADEVEWTIKCKILRYSWNTWKKHTSANLFYFQMCESRDIDSYPVNVGILNLSLLSLAQKGKSIGVIESAVNAISFFSEFLGCGSIAGHYNVKQMQKFLSKVCVKRTNKKEGLRAHHIRKIWNKMEKIGLHKLKKSTLRSFVMAVFMHSTFCRFSDAVQLKVDDLVYHENYFDVKINFSKTDQNGEGQYCILPNNNSPRNPHKLMCLYLQTMGFSEVDDAVDHVYLFPPLK